MESIGTIIATQDSPSINYFSFVIKKPVRQGEFVSVKTEEGILIGTIEEIFKTNKYFESAGAVSQISETSITANFPVKEWEYTIAKVKILSLFSENMFKRAYFPPAPGSDILQLEPEFLSRFLGLDKNGIHLGKVQQQNLTASFNLTKTFQKHLAIIAMSGSGKSYATSVLIEELLDRKKEQGNIALLIIDNHGEYIGFSQDPNFRNKVSVIDSSKIRLNISYFNEHSFKALLPGLSSAQVRELGKVIHQIKLLNQPYSLKELISKIEADESIKSSIKDPLISWLVQLEHMNLFASTEFPNLNSVLEVGKAVILNLGDTLNLTKKQLIVNYLSRRLFDLRRKEACPPYLEIIEEAHNFCPEGTREEKALSKSIIETIAREGRKFYAGLCLISQRPIKLSTTALSQCNTQIILRINNPYDLEHIKKSFESISSQTTNMISSLRVGEALVLGEAVNYPVFVNIRKRKSIEVKSKSLEEYSKSFLDSKQTLASADDFM